MFPGSDSHTDELPSPLQKDKKTKRETNRKKKAAIGSEDVKRSLK